MKLVVFDVEGTIFESGIALDGTVLTSTVWQAIARALGPEAEQQEVRTHRKWKAGGYRTYVDWMKDTIEIHLRHGLSRTAFQSIIASAKYNPNVLPVLRSLDRQRFEPILVSGGFHELSSRAQVDLRISHSIAAAEYFFGTEGRISGYNLFPCDFEGKVDFVRLMLKELGFGDHDWIFVGDGANDVKIAQAAPVAIGYRPHPDLRPFVKHSIKDFSELPSILDALEGPNG